MVGQNAVTPGSNVIKINFKSYKMAASDKIDDLGIMPMYDVGYVLCGSFLFLS